MTIFPNEMIEQLTVEMARTPTVEPEHASLVMEEMVALARAVMIDAKVEIDFDKSEPAPAA